MEDVLQLATTKEGEKESLLFLCHNSLDKPLVREIADALELETGTPLFLDIFAIPVGEEFIPCIERALKQSSGCAIFLGANGWGQTHLWEAERALARYREEPEFRLLPVALPGLREDDSQRLGDGKVFQYMNWADFRNGPRDDEALDKLLATVTGRKLPQHRGPARLTPYQIRRDAGRWREAQTVGEKRSILYRGDQLEEAERIVVANPDYAVLAEVQPFISAAQRAARARLRRTAFIAGVVLVSTLGAAMVAVVQTAAVAERVADARAVHGLRYLEDRDQHNAERMFRESLYISNSQIARQGLIRSLQKPVTLEARWVAEGDELTSVAFVTESRIAVGDKAGRVRLVDPLEGAEIWSVVPVGVDAGAVSGHAINDLIYDDATGQIVAGSESGVVFWLDPATGATDGTHDAGHAVLSLRRSIETGLLALGTRGGLLVLDRDRQAVVDMIHGHAGTVQGLAFNHVGDTIYWGGSTKRIWACQIGTNPCQQLQHVDEWVYSIDVDPTGRFSAHGEGGRVTVLDHFLQRGEAVARGGAHVFALRFDPSGSLLIAGDSGGRIAAYDVRAQSLVQSTAAGDGQIYDIAFSPSGERFASAGLRGAVSIWQVSGNAIAAPTYEKLGARNPAMLTREQPTAIHDIRIFDGHAALVTDSQTRQHLLPIVPDTELPNSEEQEEERLFAERALRSQRTSYSRAWAAREIDTIAAWRELYPERIDELRSLPEDAHRLQTATSGDNRMLAVTGSGRLTVLSPDSDMPRTVTIDQAGVTALAIKETGDLVFLGTNDGAIAVLPIGGGSAGEVDCDDSDVFAIFHVASAAQVVAATADGTLCLVDGDGQLVERVQTSAAMAFAASPELNAVAIAGVDGTINLFTLALERVAEFRGHRGSVNALHFSVDGRLLFSGGEDEALRSWPAEEAVYIQKQPWSVLIDSDLDRRALHQELPFLWPFLRWVGYL